MSQGLFSVSVVSLPLNFTILLHPDSIASLGIEENGYALVKGINGLITVVKVIKDQDCPKTGTRITHSVQMTLGTSPGDSVPILPFSGNEHCEAIQIAPLFDKNSLPNESSDFTQAVKQYFQTDPRPISVDSIFTLLIDSEERAFKILKCSPTDRSFSSKSTKLYFTAEPGPLLPKPLISKHLNTLVLDKQIVNFVKNNIYYPVNRQNVLRSLNIPTSTGIIIEGQSGSGKTSLLSAISNTINIPSIYCQSKRLKKLSVSDYVEKLNQVFGYTAEKPQCLIMFDDIDYIVSSFRQSKLTADRVKLATFFNLLDAVMNRGGIFIIATSSSPQSSLDPALLRDGRFGQRIILNQPTLDQRKELIRLYTGGMRVEDEDLNEIVRKIGGKEGENNSPSTVSAKEIERICRVAVTTLIEEATGNQGTEVVDSLAVYTLNTKMKSMHFGVTTTGRGGRKQQRNRNDFEDENDEDDEEGSRRRRRRRHRRRHRYGDDDEEDNNDDGDDDEDGGGSRRRRHRRHRRRRHRGDEDDEDNEDENENQEEDDDEDGGGSQRRRRHRRHRNDSASSSNRSGSRRHSSRRRRYNDEEDEDEDTNGRSRRRQRNNNNFNGDDDEEEEGNQAFRRGRQQPPPQRSRNNGRRGRFNQDADEEEEDEDPFAKRAAAAGGGGGRAQQMPKRRARDEDDEDEDDQSPFNRNKRSPFKGQASGFGGRRKNNNNVDDDYQQNSDDDEGDDDDGPFNRRNKRGSQQRRAPPRGGRNINDDDDEQDDDNETENRMRGSRPRRRNGGRGFGDDDEDNEDDDDNRNSRRRNNKRRNRDDENEDDEDDEGGRRSRTKRSMNRYQEDDSDEEPSFPSRRRRNK